MGTEREWTHHDEWTLRSSANTHTVTVKHRFEAPYRSGFYDRNDGGHRWFVYGYVYPKHPLFAKFDGDSLWQAATDDLPLHGGCTYLHYHRDGDGKVVSIQFGADYRHLHDDRFSYAEEFDGDVKNDAEGLFERLSQMTEVAAPTATEASRD